MRRTCISALWCAAQAVLCVVMRYGAALLHEQAGQGLGEDKRKVFFPFRF